MKKYFRHKIQNLIVVDKIVTVHYFEFNKNFRGSVESHDFWELVFAAKEDVLCTANGVEIPLAQGEILFHKPNESHSLAANGKKAPNVVIVSFECKSEAIRFFEGKRVRANHDFTKLLYTILEEARKTFSILFSDPKLEKMELLPTPTLGGQQLIKNYLEILLINIMRALTETERGNKIFLQREELGNKLVKDVIRILERNICHVLTVGDICAETGYSRAYVFKEFRAATGKSVMEYFIALKIEEAKRHLREDDMTVKEISEHLAFDTPNYFSKTFKRYTGLTPSTYKKFALNL